MDYNREIIKLIEDGNKALESFKSQIVNRIDALESAEAKSNRPLIGGEKIDQKNPEIKAFNRFLRTGDDSEYKSLAVTTNSGADGGYAVPKQIDSLIQKVAINYNPMRSICNVRECSTADFHMLIAKTRAANGWVGETAARPETMSPSFYDVNFSWGDLYANPFATQRMIDDANFDVANWLAEEIGQVFGAAEGAAFVSGSGLSQPTGFLWGTPTTQVDGVRSWGTLQYIPTGVSGGFPASNPGDFLLSIIFKLKVGYRTGACWVMSSSCLAQISGWKDSYGRYIFAPSTAPGIPATIWGYPVIECEDMPPVAANSLSIAFGNFKLGYTIADRMPGTRILVDPYSNKPFVGYYATRRVSGAVTNSEAIKLVKLSAT